MIKQPLRSTDEGKVKLDLEELIRIISVLSSLSFNLFCHPGFKLRDA